MPRKSKKVCGSKHKSKKIIITQKRRTKRGCGCGSKRRVRKSMRGGSNNKGDMQKIIDAALQEGGSISNSNNNSNKVHIVSKEKLIKLLEGKKKSIGILQAKAEIGNGNISLKKIQLENYAANLGMNFEELLNYLE
jgi:hypothetical protein